MEVRLGWQYPRAWLRACSSVLSDVFTDVFNFSLAPSVHPHLLQVHRHQWRGASHQVMPHLKRAILDTLYPLQFTYRKKKQSPDDAVNAVIHTALAHLEGKDAECCLLTTPRHSTRVIPQRIADKLLTVGLAPSLCNWVLNFPTDRNQSVRVGHRTSSTRMVIGLITG